MAFKVVRSVAEHAVLFRKRLQLTPLRTVPVGGMRLWQGAVAETVSVSEGMPGEAGECRSLLSFVVLAFLHPLCPKNQRDGVLCIHKKTRHSCCFYPHLSRKQCAEHVHVTFDVTYWVMQTDWFWNNITASKVTHQMDEIQKYFRSSKRWICRNYFALLLFSTPSCCISISEGLLDTLGCSLDET